MKLEKNIFPCIPRAVQTLRVSTADYRVAKIDFLQIIENWTDLLTFQIQLARQESSLSHTLASLDRVIGFESASLTEIPITMVNDGRKP